MVANKAFMFLRVPEGGEPVIGEHIAVQDIGFDPDAPAPESGLTAEVHYASFDPYLRGRMRDPAIKSYNKALIPGEPIDNFCVGTVLKSNIDGLVPGDLVRGYFPIAQYAVISTERAKAAPPMKLPNPHGLDERYFVGPLGMAGLTAYSSLYEIGLPKKGETIFVSAASGAVGQIVGQLAKHEGLRVIGSVGSQEKLDFITKDLGFDGGFNYKTEKPSEALARLAPEGLDIYYDNVGGEQLSAAIDAANLHARFVECGMISQYNAKSGEEYNVKNLMKIVSKRLNLRGFIVSDLWAKYYSQHLETVSGLINDGSFKVSIHETDGIDKAAEGFLGMFRGENFGKAVLKLKSS